MKKLNIYIDEKLKITKDTKINRFEKNIIWETLGKFLGAYYITSSLSDYINGKIKIDKDFFKEYQWKLPNIFNHKDWVYGRNIKDTILDKFNSIIHDKISNSEFEEIKYNIIEGFKKALQK